MSNSNPKISVILPSLNVAEFIEECIESVINQTLSELEIICVDAGSNDGTLEILKNYAKKDSRVSIILSDVKSYGHQMNLGINASNGEYIGIVETDDYIDKKMYETLYNLTNKGSADISKANFYHLYDEESGNTRAKADDTKKNLPESEFTIYNDANILNGHPCIWAAIYKKEFLMKNNIKFMEAPGGGWVDNPFLFETFILAKNIRYTDEPFYYYRELNPNSSTNNIKDVSLPMKRMENVLDLLDKYNCQDVDVLAAFYVRVFHHVHESLEKYNLKNKELEVYNYFSKVLRRLNKNIIDKRFSLRDQKVFYKYRSPITLIKKYEPGYKITSEDFKYIIEENNFLYNYYEELSDNNKLLKREYQKIKQKNDKLSKNNKKINNDINLIKKSKAYKMGSMIATPVRKVKKIRHNHSLDKFNLLFIFSHSNTDSASFNYTISLIKSLKGNSSINIFAILPNDDEGSEILSSLNVPYEIIDSFNWTVPFHQIKFIDEINKKQKCNIESIKKIRRFIKRNNIDLVHISSGYSYVGAKAAIDEHIPFVWCLMNGINKNKVWDKKQAINLINTSNIIFINSNIAANDFNKDKLVYLNGDLSSEEISKIVDAYLNCLK